MTTDIKRLETLLHGLVPVNKDGFHYFDCHHLAILLIDVLTPDAKLTANNAQVSREPLTKEADRDE